MRKQKFRLVIGRIKAAISRQRNISIDVKFSVKELEEAIDVSAHWRAN